MKSVLITGGSGFFGRHFAQRLIADPEVKRVCIYSRGEYAQAQMRQELSDPNSKVRYFIGDVRDKDRLSRAMEGCDVVVHAAALKRIEAVDYNVMEGIKTNVIGTQNVVDAAIDTMVRKVVFLSTDKACNPTTTYGLSKALAERIVGRAHHYAGTNGPLFATTRYGNVWNSTGSVVPFWRRLLKASDSVPVTDLDCTRFFMTIDQAVDLVLDTIETMQGNELVIPTLPAYRLGDLAEAMGAKQIVCGLAEEEKKHEEMRPGETSDLARRMGIDEIREALRHV